ncbi:unnamed protein product [Owenia fusiformis]|uniref:Uncharacterized protein n=1 Tax=Owenia fusiformis TaxID=6347 RepID=A0A8S4NSX1_OWEFU|nr:unnamed protein product [Owenia fusiformis]
MVDSYGRLTPLVYAAKHNNINLLNDILDVFTKIKTADFMPNIEETCAEFVERIAELCDQYGLSVGEIYNVHVFESIWRSTEGKGDLEERLHKFELEKTRLEADLKAEKEKNERLEREYQDSNQVRNTMEALLSNLKTSTIHMEDKLNEETAHRTLFEREAEDSKALWESEVKSRSKLGLRIAQLEREKIEVQGNVDEERRKARKAAELKRVAEVRYQGESERVIELERQVATLKAHLKAARKRLKDLDNSDSRVNSLRREFDSERSALEATIGALRRQLDDCRGQLDLEIERKDKLEATCRAQQAELNSLSSLEKTALKQEKARRRIEDEFNLYKSHVQNNYIDRGELARKENEIKLRTQAQIQDQLTKVNHLLDEQASKQENIYSMHSNEKSQLKESFEKSRNELMEELARMRQNYDSVVTQQEVKDLEMSRMKDQFDNEIKFREKLSDRLQSANDVAAMSKAELMLERQKLRILANTGGATSPQAAWADSPLASKKPSHGLNDSLSYKIKTELDKSIAKHLERGPHLNLSTIARSVDDSILNKSQDKSSMDYMSTLKRNYFV